MGCGNTPIRLFEEVMTMTKFMNKYWLEVVYISSVLCFVLAFSFFLMTDYAQTISSGLSESVIRFHVIANSDTTEDQLLKENVRDAVLMYMEPILADSPSIEETRSRINDHMDEITEVAQTILTNWGKDYGVYTELTKGNTIVLPPSFLCNLE